MPSRSPRSSSGRSRRISAPPTAGAFTAREPELNRANLAELGDWYAAGKIKPYVSAKFPLERAADALNAILERKATGKIVLTTGRS